MTHHLLTVDTAGSLAIVGINGAPLLVDADGLGLRGTRAANPWLKSKGNTLTLSLAAPPPSRGAVKLPALKLRAQVYTVLPGSPTNEPDRILATYEQAAGDRIPLPVTREIAFEIADVPPTHLWADAAPVRALSAADKQQLRALVQKHAQAIADRDLDGLGVMLDYKIKDCALANGQDPDEMRRVVRRQYIDEMFTESSLTIDGARGEALEFKLFAGGQAVWLCQSLTKPALVVVSPNKRFTLPIYAAMIGGAWRIVR